MGPLQMAKTQKQEILDHLEKYGSISRRDADLYGITDLPRRICDLKKDGYEFDKERKKHKVTGQVYVRYSFKKVEAGEGA